jgi:hypothetical protein
LLENDGLAHGTVAAPSEPPITLTGARGAANPQFAQALPPIGDPFAAISSHSAPAAPLADAMASASLTGPKTSLLTLGVSNQPGAFGATAPQAPASPPPFDSAGQGSSSVTPEPAGLMLVIGALMLLLVRPRRSSR